ncbi:hypothetical protein PGT21_034830 [Puccinia graminis f. sp. tritici]|uniref:Uncharacterized protein n=1 Tax=Puccinia graminis f. sp. tritici TaxID=56615 RepID=A0A5B0PPV5_PUCGR|nr:hypothetical protein PGT21_034830 [Puccinia graminis f. sp. tritici]
MKTTSSAYSGLGSFIWVRIEIGNTTTAEKCFYLQLIRINTSSTHRPYFASFQDNLKLTKSLDLAHFPNNSIILPVYTKK